MQVGPGGRHFIFGLFFDLLEVGDVKLWVHCKWFWFFFFGRKMPSRQFRKRGKKGVQEVLGAIEREIFLFWQLKDIKTMKQGPSWFLDGSGVVSWCWQPVHQGSYLVFSGSPLFLCVDSRSEQGTAAVWGILLNKVMLCLSNQSHVWAEVFGLLLFLVLQFFLLSARESVPELPKQLNCSGRSSLSKGPVLIKNYSETLSKIK